MENEYCTECDHELTSEDVENGYTVCEYCEIEGPIYVGCYIGEDI